MMATSAQQSAASTSVVKHYEHYFTPAEVDHLSSVQRGKQSIRQADATRLAACAFAECVGARLGFPRRTIATAQLLYHRFHLFFPLKDFPSYHEPVLATLYVSAKLHDTLKKPREIVLASYGVRFPELLGGKATLGEGDVDVNMLEADRLKVLSIERLVLETVCFNFSVDTPFGYVIKFGKALGASKALTLAAYRISIDCYRTLLPLTYPPHTLALSSIYVACLLARQPPVPTNQHSQEVEEKEMILERAKASAVEEVLAAHGGWEAKYGVQLADVEDITHLILDLFALVLEGSTSSSMHRMPPSTSATSSQNTSPSTTSPESSDATDSFSTTAVRLLSLSERGSSSFTTPLKIALRTRTRLRAEPVESREMTERDWEKRAEREQEGGVGKNQGTVRFLFS